jgi:hypothetical protein
MDRKESRNMKTMSQLAGVVALALTVGAPILFMTHTLSEAMMKTWMLVGCVLWFASAPAFLKGGSQ